MTVVAVVIDKRRMTQRYANPTNPYHVGIQYGLERVRHFLHLQAQHEALTHIVCEARGAKEEADRELAFRQGVRRRESPARAVRVRHRDLR
jgi:hypothetical protein